MVAFCAAIARGDFVKTFMPSATGVAQAGNVSAARQQAGFRHQIVAEPGWVGQILGRRRRRFVERRGGQFSRGGGGIRHVVEHHHH